MKRTLICALLCAALALNLAGCAGQSAPSASAGASASASAAQSTPAGESVTFTDDLGREVTLSSPKRVAALIGSFADVWCLAGGKDTLVAAADDSWTQFDLGLGEEVKNLGAVKTPSQEILLAADPDFVIGSTKTAADVELMDLMDELGIPAACFDISSYEDYLRMLDICTQLTGDTEAYEQHGTAVQEQIDAARSRADGSNPTVLYVRATGSSCKVKNSENTVLGEMLADLGCVNIADSETSLLESLSMETILACDPEYIFVVLQGSDPTDAEITLQNALLSDPAWNSLTAVKEGRLYYMDQQLYNVKPNARWGEAYEKLADILYPEE
ncbi:ABC transporter substrate-binding protein [Lawsonibacter sp. LCP25S3_G6]|uniref:ABC transporter substrate-binding protein n=1 Tax=unclassified Lawsonibacter TaxID=2617946 RepID=UPI003F9560C1